MSDDRFDTWIKAAQTVAGAIGCGVVIAFLVLALISPRAHAQLLLPDGKLNGACAAEPIFPPLPVPPPPRSFACLPKQIGGTGTDYITGTNAKGAALGWWCPQVEPEKARLALFAVKWDAATPAMAADFARLAAHALARNQTEVQNVAIEMTTRYATLNIRDMCDVWASVVAPLNAIHPASLPPPPPPGTWRSVGGAVFRHANGRLTGSVSGKTAAAGLACTGVTVATAGSFVYQELVGGAVGEATRCAKP